MIERYNDSHFIDGKQYNDYRIRIICDKCKNETDDYNGRIVNGIVSCEDCYEDFIKDLYPRIIDLKDFEIEEMIENEI